MSTTPRRAWAGLATLLLPVFLVSMDASVLYLAMPHVTSALNPTAEQQLWILDIYPFMLAGLLITMGNLGDRLGRRRLMTGGAALFGVASVIAAFAPNAELLIAARALMGLGGATLLPASLALIANIFLEPRPRAIAIGVWSASFSFGMAIGPVLGGLLLHHFWWGSVFLINAPVFLAFLIAAPLLVDESRRNTAARFDLVGVALSMAAIFPVVYAVKSSASHGVSLRTTVIGLVGVALLVAFIAHQRRAPYPLIPFDMFRNRVFAMAVLGTVVAMATLGSMSYLTGIYLQSVLGFDVLAAALIGLPTAAVVAFFSMRAPAVQRRLGRRATFTAALLLAAVGQFMLIGLGVGGPTWIYVVGTVVAGAGYGTLFTFVSAAVLAAAPPERAGQASSMSEMAFELGTALGLAMLGSVATAVFTSHDGMARTVGDTLAQAGAVGGPDGATLADSAKSAWVDAVTTTVGVSGVLLLATAATAAIVMRSLPSEDADAAPLAHATH